MLNYGRPVAFLKLQEKSLRDGNLISVFIRIISRAYSSSLTFINLTFLSSGFLVVALLVIVLLVYIPDIFYLLYDKTILKVYAALFVVIIYDIYKVINILNVLVFFLYIRALDLSLLIS